MSSPSSSARPSPTSRKPDLNSYPLLPLRDQVLLPGAVLPLLVKQGYSGPIYAQNATGALCEILLEDSASLQRRDAEYENKWRKRKKKLA